MRGARLGQPQHGELGCVRMSGEETAMGRDSELAEGKRAGEELEHKEGGSTEVWAQHGALITFVRQGKSRTMTGGGGNYQPRQTQSRALLQAGNGICANA
ncbi:putative G-protein coupled receptor 132 [Platysternon megacephalum]|uniref:Putative G-protein coupled receptor 132 n=1 Tax=Platysternon megacephalum TaxID=55544 RepID=A0A4D9DWS5_9SAUR|nr:putative G-protein coupled receptor 132 [Platysternon megacephalum]